MNTQELANVFQEKFGTPPLPRSFFAPGRINLIGEHTDYNGGHVFPASISLGTYAIGNKRNDKRLRLYSMNFAQMGIMECDLSDLSFNDNHDWANYPKGMLLYLQKSGYDISHGADILFFGNIPSGAGLSSSASIEMVTGILLEGIYDLTIDRLKIIQLGQMVENEYIGVNSGIMDQFAVGKGMKDHAILLNCKTLEYQYAPISLKKHAVIIINSNKQRTLSGSKYNERRKQCELALKDLQTECHIDSLGELTIEEFEKHKHLITNITNRKRTKHIVYENARTLEALDKLRMGDLQGFGKLMNESHISLKDDYEVTGLELDTIVQAAWKQEGILGARMTGAGFGGCAIAIVEKNKVEDFKKKVNAIYHRTIGYDATFYTASIGDGAKEISKEVVQ
ncbi:galactokinase [Oceanobacillus massiliensis]|uniref:galactokinase n=1 Tax=Oceanobacillus massiliensis TaxID=1465765 RepID=UPI00028830E3|nr:galactokinase [Oceanobacillus massiliensis]